jgi:hypothetical protein
MLRRFAQAMFLLLGMPGLLSAQYFGRNKVQYTNFDFKVIQTEHFDVYYYPGGGAGCGSDGRALVRAALQGAEP